MSLRYSNAISETRHRRRVKAYRVVVDFLAFAALMALAMLIAVM